MTKKMDVVKTIVAGCIVEHYGFRIIQKGDSPQVRAAKKQCSTIGRKLTNHRTMAALSLPSDGDQFQAYRLLSHLDFR